MVKPGSRFAVPVVLAAVAVDTLGYGIVLPVLPSLITQLGHVDLAQATRMGGWLLATYAFAQILAGPVVGQLGDRFGRRPVMIASMATFAVDYFVMAAAPTLGWLFLGRAIAGLTGSVTGPAGAVIADLSPPEKRAASFGWIGAAFGIGFVLGPAVGGLVSRWGLRAPFILAAALAALNALAMLLLLPETLKRENRRAFRIADATVIGSFKPLFALRNATSLVIANFLWQVGGTIYPAIWSFWASLRFGWSARAIGWSLGWIGLLMALVQAVLTGPVIKRFGERRAAMLGLGCGAACFVAYAFASEGWQVYAFFLVGSLAAIAWPALNGLLSRLTDASRQGALQGGTAATNSLASIIGPLVGAQTLAWGARHGFDGAAFILAAGLLTASALLIALRVPHLSFDPKEDSPG